jgi:hypothetical protein
MKASGARGSSGAAMGAVALASMLNPVSSSMLAVARPHGRRAFATRAGTGTWLDPVASVVALGGTDHEPAL